MTRMRDALARAVGFIDGRPRIAVAVVLALAAVLLTLHAWNAPLESAGPDGKKYEAMGWAAAESPSLFTCGNFRHAYWTPGWIATIGAVYRVVGRRPLVIRLFLVAVALVTAWLASRSARRLSGARASVFAPALFLFSTLLFRYTTYYQYEVLLAGLTALSAALLFRGAHDAGTIRGVAAGVLLGAAAVVSPRVLVFVPLVAAAALAGSRRASLRTTAGVVVGLAVVLVPWTARNYRCFGEVIVTTSNGGINLYIANNEHATGGYYLPPDDVRPGHPLTDSGAWTREALEYVRRHPAQTAARTVVKAARFWNPHFGDQFLVALLLVSGWVRFWRSRPRVAPETAWVLAAPFAMMLVHMVFFVQPRYMIPVLPFVCVVAGAGVGGWRSDPE